jgi:hypothetical protein
MRVSELAAEEDALARLTGDGRNTRRNKELLNERE